MSERCEHHFVAEMYGATCEKCDRYLDTDELLMRADFYEAHINEHNRLKAQMDELRAFRDGYDPKVMLPKEDKDYPGYSTPVLTFGHSPDGVDFEVERLALYDDYSDGYVIRWYPLPPLPKGGE